MHLTFQEIRLNISGTREILALQVMSVNLALSSGNLSIVCHVHKIGCMLAICQRLLLNIFVLHML